jgi:hypothetical protein
MILNLAISAAIGIVPIIGDVLLASYRANIRNARLLENFLSLRGERVSTGGTRTSALATSEKETEKDKSDGDAAANADADTDADQGAAGGRITVEDDDDATALPEKMPPASLMQPAVGAAASTSDCGKTTLVPDSVEGDDKGKSAMPVPDSVDADDQARFLRPARNPLEFVQHRDSRFIEDVS